MLKTMSVEKMTDLNGGKRGKFVPIYEHDKGLLCLRGFAYVEDQHGLVIYYYMDGHIYTSKGKF